MPSETREAFLPLGAVSIEERLAKDAPQVLQDHPCLFSVPEEPLLSDMAQDCPRDAKNAAPRLPLPTGRLLRPLHAILADLRRPLPAQCIPSFKGPAGVEIDFLSWHQITHLLHVYAPGWYCEVAQIHEMESLMLILRLVIISAEGRTAYEGIGREDPPVAGAKPNAYGDRARRTYARALKHAAQLLGMDWLQEENEKNQSLAALDKYLQEEQAARIKTLGEACDKAGIDKVDYLKALCASTCVSSWKHLPVAVLIDAISCVDDASKASDTEAQV